MIFLRSFLLLCIVLFFYLSGFSQKDNFNRRDSTRILNARFRYLTLRLDKNQQQKQIPVSRIEFADMRFDTTFIALNWRGESRIKYNLSDGLATHLTRYYQHQYRQDTTDNKRVLVCFIKQFSVLPKQDVLEHYMQTPTLMNWNDDDIHIDIACFYRRGDSLYPALQLDTSYSDHFVIGQTLQGVIEDMLQPFENMLETMDTTTIFRRKHYGSNVVWPNYIQRFNVPLLTAGRYKNGIYKSFAELRNQTPSVDSFYAMIDKKKLRATAMQDYDIASLLTRLIQKRNSNVFLYDAHDELIDPSGIYAYCSDGETIWIQHGASYYPLVKTGNSFEFLYIYRVPDTRNSYNITTTYTLLMPLNMETGKSN